MSDNGAPPAATRSLNGHARPTAHSLRGPSAGFKVAPDLQDRQERRVHVKEVRRDALIDLRRSRERLLRPQGPAGITRAVGGLNSMQ
jgi:hypothetical protein